MQSVAMQMKENDQAVVVSMAAPSSYCRRPIRMVGSCALSTVSADPSGGRAARCVYQNSPMMVRPADVDSTMLTGVLASTS